MCKMYWPAQQCYRQQLARREWTAHSLARGWWPAKVPTEAAGGRQVIRESNSAVRSVVQSDDHMSVQIVGLQILYAPPRSSAVKRLCFIISSVDRSCRLGIKEAIQSGSGDI